jgi:hypothetical protein
MSQSNKGLKMTDKTISNEQILINRLLWLLTDLNSNIDAESAELIFYDLQKVTGKSQTEISQWLEHIHLN